MRSEVRIELANIQHGGALQVAGSLLDESARLLRRGGFATRWPWLGEATFNVNSAVLGATTEDLRPLNISNHDLRGRGALRGARHAPIVNFTLFGPLYGLHPTEVAISGFADVTSLYPELCRPHTPKYRIRRQMSKHFFRAADLLIVESPHVGEDLSARWGIPSTSIVTVPNTLNSAAMRSGNTAARNTAHLPSLDRGAGQAIILGYPTRPYPHKNLSFLGQSLAAWKHAHPDIPVRLLLTLDEA